MKASLARLFLALAVFAGALGAYGVWYQTVSAQSAVVADLENQISQKTETSARIASARAALTEVAGDEAAVRSYFVSPTNVVGFIDDLQARGRALGATVSVLSVNTDTASAHTALTLSIKAVGSFDAVMRTVGAIEYAPYDISLGTVGVGLDNRGVWHADVALSVGTAPN